MERIRNLRFPVLSLLLATILILGSCKEVPTNESSEVSENETTKRVARKGRQSLGLKGIIDESDDLLKAYEAVVKPNGQLKFGKISKSLLQEVANPNLRSVLILKFKRDKPFPASRLRVALNGIRAVHPKLFNFQNISEWKEINREWELHVDLSALRFTSNRQLLAQIQNIQKGSGRVVVWILAPSRIRLARLLFFEREASSHPIPTVVFDSITPTETPTRSRRIAFEFSSPEGGTQFECAFDSKIFQSCQSPQVFEDLHRGSHRLKVRAHFEGERRGPVADYHFQVVGHDSNFKLASVEPPASPTSSGSIRFILSGGKKNFYCRLDGAQFVRCQSPVLYENLSEGSHQFEAASSRKCGKEGDDQDEKEKKKKGKEIKLQLCEMVAPQVSYVWVVDRTPPVVEWGSAPPSLINISEMNFSFRSNEVGEFHCSLDGRAPESCQSPFQVTRLSEGSHRFSVFAIDRANNQSIELAHSFLVDTTPPSISLSGVTPQKSPSNLPELTLSFSVDEPAHIHCALDGGSPVPCTSPVFYPELPEGKHEIVVTGRDSAGNEAVPLTYSWVIDMKAPVLTLNLLEPVNIPSNQRTAVFEWWAEELFSAECSLDGGIPFSCDSPYRVNDLSEGTHELKVVPVDSAGNRGEATFRWIIDLTPPEVTYVAAVPSESVTRSTSLELSFGVSEASKSTCTLDAASPVPCSSPYVVNGLLDGIHSIVVNATDSAGNVSNPFNYRWEVVTRAVAILDRVLPQEPITSNRNIQFDFSSSPSNSFICSLNGSASSPCSSPAIYWNLSDGSHQFVVRAVSPSGEVGDGATHEWAIDSTAPQITIISAPPPLTNNCVVSVAFSTDTPASTFCSMDGGIASSCLSPVTVSGVLEGTHRLDIVAEDALGNRSSATSVSWTVDLSAPVVTLGAADPSLLTTSRTTMSLSFSANESVSSFCALDGGSFITCVSPYAVSGLSVGGHSIRIKAVDGAGNVGSEVSYAWTVDTTPVITSNVLALEVTRIGARITWSTNLVTSSQVEYGTSPSLGQVSSLDSSLVTSHSVSLTGLRSFTLYYFRTKSVDIEGRVSYSNTLTLRTSR